MKILATVRDYDTLHRALRARKDALEVTMSALDEAAGWADGHASHLLAPRPTKKLGAETLGLMLQTLGVQLLLVEDAEMTKRITSKMPKREVASCMPSVTRKRGRHSKKPNDISKKFLRKIGRKGGQAYAKTAFKVRSRVGMAGAKARWKKPTLIEITKPNSKP